MVTTPWKLRTSGSDVNLDFKTFDGEVISPSDSVVFDLSDSSGNLGYFRVSSGSLSNPTLGAGAARFGFYSSAAAPDRCRCGIDGDDDLARCE